jgi:2,3-dihydroxybiphenyl 1,2-dioxygenase
VTAAVTQFGYIVIGVSDIKAWEEYATDVLGMEINGREEDGSLRLRMDQYSYRIVVHPSGEDDIVVAGWEVKDEHALNDLASRLRAEGVDVQEATPEDLEARDVIGMIKFHDPAGLATEVFYGPHLEKVRPFVSPRGVQFETGENGSMGFGHMVVAVPDLQQCLTFYRDILGLRISDYIDMAFGPNKFRIAFFHANPRHHSIAFGGPLNPGAGAALPGPRKRLNHFMLQVKELDYVGITFNLVEDKGIRTGKLGRHTNDHMFSFYMETPSGFNVEYGWGGREVDDEKWEVQYYKEASIWGHGQPQEPPRREAAAAGAS